MRTRTLSRSRRPGPLLALLLAVASGLASARAADLPAAKTAMDYPAVDVHSKEQVAIAAEPFDTAEKCKVFQVDYLKYHFMPFRIIVTNDGDRPISLKDARIYLISSAGDRIPAAEPDDVERRTKPKDSGGMGVPVGPIRLHPKGKDPDKKIEQDFDRFEYGALVVEPHTTHDGFLFYDVEGLGGQPLRGAKLEFRELRNADGQELFSFDVPLSRYLDAQH